MVKKERERRCEGTGREKGRKEELGKVSGWEGRGGEGREGAGAKVRQKGNLTLYDFCLLQSSVYLHCCNW